MPKKYGWEEYLVIESDFIQARKFLAFDRQSNLDADSPFLHNEIVLLGSKVETAMKVLIKSGIDKEVIVKSISDYKALLLVMAPDIERYQVTIVGSDASPIRPFEGWSSSSLSWWSAYSEIKHGSSSRLPKLEHGLNLLAAFEILLHLIHVIEAKNRNESHVVYGLSELPKLLNLGFDGLWVLDRERPFLFGYEVSNYNLCKDMAAIKAMAQLLKSEKKD